MAYPELAEAAVTAPAGLRVLPRQAGPSVHEGGLLDPVLEADPAGLLVRTLVRVGPGGEAALLRAGARIGARAGSIVTARIPLAALPVLLAEPSIRAVEAAAALRPPHMELDPGSVGPRFGPPNDSAVADAGFDALRRRVGAGWEGLAGQGVVIGVYDSGLDLAHDDFRSAGGGSRVLFAWDQTGTSSPPGPVGAHLFDYGTECSVADVDEGGCPMVDRVGHGTHVAGIATGDGSATGRGMAAFRFAGGAPRAELIVVKGGDGVFTSDRLLDGVAYVFARATALGRPAVVNVSLSSQSGPHDGTTLLEEALDALSGPGRIVVSAAGNSGDHRNTFPAVANGPFHAEGTAPGPTHAVRIPAYQPAPGSANDGVVLEVWYEGSDSLEIELRTPRGDVVAAATGDSASIITAGGAAAILNAVDGPAPSNGDQGALIAILDFEASTPPDTGRWEIRVRPVSVHAGGGYHLWLTGAAIDAPVQPALEGGTTNRYLVGVPGSANRVLAAGAHVTRHEWLGVGEEPAQFPIREPLGAIAYFSSPGPRRDGVSKPDITAPGKVLISALAEGASLWDELPWLIEADSVHVGLLGTSMAAPQVAAAVAILLQIQPDLTPEDARDLLRLSAASDAFVDGPAPHPAWGAGKLDAAAAASRLRPAGLAGPDRPVSLSANPIRSDALVIGYSERPRSVAVYTLVAERVRGFAADELGPLTTVWPLDTDAGGDVANGAYVLVVEFADRRVVRKLFVARP